MPSFTLGEIARRIDATPDGDTERTVQAMSPLDDAGPHDLSYADSPKLVERVRASAAAACIVGTDFPALPGRTLLRAERPKRAFIRALELFHEPLVPAGIQPGIHPSAVLAADVALGEDVTIGPCAVLEAGVRVGAGTRIHAGVFVGRDSVVGAECQIGPNATLLHGTRVGDRCILHPGVVLGADGYGFHWTGDHHHKIPQIGVVVVEDEVEIGANTCIDRATLGETRIGRGTKLDNLVHIAHNNLIGRHVLLTAQVAVAGSSTLGDGVVAGGQAGVSDHVKVGAGVQIGGQTGVTSDIEPGARVWGTPARPMQRVMREQAAVTRLPELLKTVRSQQGQLEELRKRIATLEAQLAE